MFWPPTHGIRRLTMSATVRRGIVAALAAILAILVATPATADPTAPPGTPTATTFEGVPTVGPLFRNGLGSQHSCTASVVASPHGNLILTAAHCVFGTAAGWLFAPGYDRGSTPYGVWTVTGAYVDPGWMSTQNPLDDFAILSVADHHVGGRSVAVQDVTGGNLLLPAPRSGATITDVAYNAGIDDQAITCTVPVYYTGPYPSFNCHGYVGGSSGSPWLTTEPGSHSTAVQGVIGGLHQGGCYEFTSYTSPFGGDALLLLARAASGQDPDIVPKAGSDGC
jgi:hypothetical protein